MFSKDDGSVRKRLFSSVDASREIVLAPNRTFEIVLPSNPSTGYDWVLSINHPEVVQNVSHSFTPDSSGRVGVSGETTWSLRTSKTGETKLTFSYKRQWETDTKPTRMVTFSINVR
jgi:predicted secreted protein